MKCALEIAVELAEKEITRQKAMYEGFYRNLENLDKYVEKALIEGKGVAILSYEKGFERVNGQLFECHYFTYQDERQNRPFWKMKQNHLLGYFLFDEYIEYLENHCYKVELTNSTFHGYSCTGKSEGYFTVPSLKISIK